MSEKLPISLCMISNQVSSQLLENIQDLALVVSEIVIVDTSTERIMSKETTISTNKIIKILIGDDQINFSQWRNLAIQRATQQWILFLDSDEKISKILQANLTNLIKDDQIDGYLIKRVDVFLKKKMFHGEIGQIYKLRLARKKSYHFVGAVHEVGKVNGPTSKINFPIYHFAHQSISSFFSKVSFYSFLVASNTSSYNFSKNMAELLFFPLGKFILNFIIKFGFLDGYQGLIYALIMSYHSLMVRIYRYEINLKKMHS